MPLQNAQAAAASQPKAAKGGRKAGALQFHIGEINLMLDSVDKIRPIVAQQGRRPDVRHSGRSGVRPAGSEAHQEERDLALSRQPAQPTEPSACTRIGR